MDNAFVMIKVFNFRMVFALDVKSVILNHKTIVYHVVKTVYHVKIKNLALNVIMDLVSMKSQKVVKPLL